MKKLIILTILLMTVASMACAEVYTSKRYKCSIEGADGWDMDTSEPRKLVTFTNKDGLSSITLRAFERSEVPTADGLAEMMSGSAYDGWQKVGSRFGSENDIFITGADDKYEAVYRKVMLNEKGYKVTTLVAEAYYVYEKIAYIVTATTTKGIFPEVKNDIRKMMKSFYIDESLATP